MATSFIFILSTILLPVLFYFGTGKNKKSLITLSFWIFVVGLISYNDFFKNTSAFPPRFIFIPLASISLSVFLFKTVAKNEISSKYLLAIHAIRLPVEIGLHQLFLQKKVPLLMTFNGWNYDIVIGISAIVLLSYSYLTKREIPKLFFMLWNIIGIFFLLWIVIIAILSSPSSFQKLAFDQPNIAILEFPFTFLPTCIVPLVFLSHFLLLKKMNQVK